MTDGRTDGRTDRRRTKWFLSGAPLCWRHKNDRKTRSESRDIDENDIAQCLGEMFGIFSRLAAEWRRLAFVYEVIRNMAMATSVKARGDSSHRKRWVLRRWKMLTCRRNWFHYYLWVCTELQVLSETASRLWFYVYKSTRTVTLQDVHTYNATFALP